MSKKGTLGAGEHDVSFSVFSRGCVFCSLHPWRQVKLYHPKLQTWIHQQKMTGMNNSYGLLSLKNKNERFRSMIARSCTNSIKFTFINFTAPHFHCINCTVPPSPTPSPISLQLSKNKEGLKCFQLHQKWCFFSAVTCKKDTIFGAAGIFFGSS